jgi:hypothetical protein
MSDKPKPGDEVVLTTRMGNEIRTKFLSWWEFETVKHDGQLTKNIGRYFDERGILFFADELEARDRNGMETTIISDGDLRSGKSTFSQVLKRVVDSPAFQDKERYKAILARSDWTLADFLDDSPLRLDECCFHLSDLHDNIIKHKPSGREDGMDTFERKCFILDESGRELNSQRWMEKYIQEMKTTMDVSAIKRQILILNLPFYRGLLRGIREQNASYLSHTQANWKGPHLLRGVVEIREGKRDRWGGETWWEGYHVCRFPQLKDDSYRAYHKKKLDYVQSLDSGGSEARELSLNTFKALFAKKYFDVQPQTQEECDKLTGLSSRTCRRLRVEAPKEPRSSKDDILNEGERTPDISHAINDKSITTIIP